MSYGRAQRRAAPWRDREYDNTNSGAFFLNDRRHDGPKNPSWTGSVDIEGREYWGSIWENETRDGQPMLKLKVRRKDEGDGYRPPQSSRGRDEYDRGMNAQRGRYVRSREDYEHEGRYSDDDPGPQSERDYDDEIPFE